MTRMSSMWVTAVCFCAVCAAFAAGQSKPNTAGKSASGGPLVPTNDVLVVNTTAQPVPTAAQGTTTVAGTVSIGNSPTVNVGNTPTVNVGNTPSVVVSNTPTVNLASGGSVNVTSPVDAQSNPLPVAVFDGFQPWEDACSVHFNGNGGGTCTFRQVPGNKRLVIQEVDVAMSLESNLTVVGLAISPNQDQPCSPVGANRVRWIDELVPIADGNSTVRKSGCQPDLRGGSGRLFCVRRISV